MLNDLYLKPAKKKTPKWCKKCGRKHRRDERCKLESRLNEEATQSWWTVKLGDQDERSSD